MVELLNKVSDLLNFSRMYINVILFFFFFLFSFLPCGWVPFFSYFRCSCGSCFSASIRLHCVDCETLGPVGVCYLLLSWRESFGEWFD